MTAFNPRQTCLWLHRYTGLAMAAFLIIAGITGTLLAFHDELDDVFNHRLAYVEAQNTPQLPIATLHDKVVSTYPEHKFSSMPTSVDADKAAVFSIDRVRGKENNTQPVLRLQDVYVNPYNGDIIGTRDKDEWAWHNTMWKVFWLHRDLLLGDIGKLIFGIVALVWTVNCFIGFYLTLPRAVKSNKAKQKVSTKKRASFVKRWLPAWKIRSKTNMFKLNYDLHHVFGLWLWLIFFVIAWSSVGFNLTPVYQPVMQALVGLEPREERPNRLPPQLKPNTEVDKRQAVAETLLHNEPSNNDVVTKINSIAYLSEQAEVVAQKNGLEVQQLLGIRWVEDDHQWQLRFKTNRDIGKKGGASSITVSAQTGRIEALSFGYQSSFGVKTDQWLSTLHMGHISQGVGHRLYQIFLAIVGLALSVLSVTGVYLWWKGRQQRLKISRQLQKGA